MEITLSCCWPTYWCDCYSPDRVFVFLFVIVAKCICLCCKMYLVDEEMGCGPQRLCSCITNEFQPMLTNKQRYSSNWKPQMLSSNSPQLVHAWLSQIRQTSFIGESWKIKASNQDIGNSKSKWSNTQKYFGQLFARNTSAPLPGYVSWMLTVVGFEAAGWQTLSGHRI